MIAITFATACHAADIHSIEQQSFSAPWSVNSILEEIAHKHSVCLVAHSNNKVVGHISMRHVINEGHISNIAVLPSYRGQGIGSQLLQALTEEAIKREMIGLTLEVRTGNHAAIGLYTKFGFATEGYRKNYYSLPTEDAAIMWKYII